MCPAPDSYDFLVFAWFTSTAIDEIEHIRLLVNGYLEDTIACKCQIKLAQFQGTPVKLVNWKFLPCSSMTIRELATCENYPIVTNYSSFNSSIYSGNKEKIFCSGDCVQEIEMKFPNFPFDSWLHRFTVYCYWADPTVARPGNQDTYTNFQLPLDFKPNVLATKSEKYQCTTLVNNTPSPQENIRVQIQTFQNTKDVSIIFSCFQSKVLSTSTNSPTTILYSKHKLCGIESCSRSIYAHKWSIQAPAKITSFLHIEEYD